MLQPIRQLIDLHIRRFLARWHRLVALISLVVTLLAGWVVASHWNLNSSLEVLLPRDSEPSRALRELDGRVGTTSTLFVVVDSPDTEANLEFAGDYADKLRQLDFVALAHYHNDRTFFEDHAALYFEADTLADIRGRVESEIKEAKKRANPLFVSLDSEEESKKKAGGGIDETIEQHKKEFEYTNYKEYLVSEDGYSAILIVRFNQPTTDLVRTNRFLEEVRQVGEGLNPEAYHGEMKIQFGGGLVARKNRYESIVDDIQLSAVFTLGGIFLLIALYFRRFRATALVLAPLVMGAVWTLALAFLIYGQLTSITVFIFAVILGLGIDYGIHLLSSYDEKLAKSDHQIDALAGAFEHTGRATMLGGVTTFATFLVIAFADFRGLAEFGSVAAIGVACTIVAMFVVLPALILTLDVGEADDAPLGVVSSQGASPGEAVGEKVRRLARYAAPVGLFGALALTAGSLFALPWLEFEDNFHNIGDLNPFWEANVEVEKTRDVSPEGRTRRQARQRADSVAARATTIREAADPESFRPERQQTTANQKYRSAVNKNMSTMPTVLLFDSRQKARQAYYNLEAARQAGEMPSVGAIDSIYAFLPGTEAEQTERMDEIRKLREVLDREDLSVLEKGLRQKIADFRKSLGVSEPVDIYDLPGWPKRFFRETGDDARPTAVDEGQDYAFEYLIFVHADVDLQQGEKAKRFLDEIRRGAGDVEAFKIASQASILVTLVEQIQSKGPRLIGIAFLLVFLIVVLAFRSIPRAVVALLPLAVGTLWMLGICTWLGLKLDVFNVVIIPAVIGIGIDDGIHFYTRYLEAGRGGIGETMRTVGTTIVMTSLTSTIGFGGLALADYAGVRSIGYLASAGILSMLLATLTVMPLVLAFAERYGLRRLQAAGGRSGEAAERPSGEA